MKKSELFEKTGLKQGKIKYTFRKVNHKRDITKPHFLLKASNKDRYNPQIKTFITVLSNPEDLMTLHLSFCRVLMSFKEPKYSKTIPVL